MDENERINSDARDEGNYRMAHEEAHGLANVKVRGATDKEIRREPEGSKSGKTLAAVYDFLDTLAKVTVFTMLLFAFVVRLNIVSGHSMDTTLYGGVQVGSTYKGGEWLVVSELFYEPKAGDIVVIHDVSATPYDEPIVKRVIATGGQTVDINFDTWEVFVDGEKINERSYIHIEGQNHVTPTVSFPLTLEENEIFVMGDNRHVSADSRIIGPIDKRCVIGKAVMRIFPINKITFFKNPYN